MDEKSKHPECGWKGEGVKSSVFYEHVEGEMFPSYNAKDTKISKNSEKFEISHRRRIYRIILF